MTPFEFYIESQAYEMKFKRDNLINIQLLNILSAFGGGKNITFDDIFGYKSLQDYNLKNINDFRENGKVNKEKWDKYLEEVIKPAKRELGLEVE